MFKCETLEEAETTLKELRKQRPAWFCPLINGPCNPECVCFFPAKIWRESNNIYVYDSYCNNAMFSHQNE